MNNAVTLTQNWPTRRRVIEDNEPLLAGEIAMTDAEFAEYCAAHEADRLAYIEAHPAPAPVEEIPACTPRQIRLWLLSAGVTDDMVRAQIDAIPDATERARALIEYEYATEFRRDHPLVQILGSALGLSATQIDQAFRAAAAL